MAQISASDPIVILSYARTPMGALSGVFADVAATDLGAAAVKAAVERAGVSGGDVERIYMGCVLPAGLGQAPARQVAIKAGLPKSVEASTVNKVCGSGMQTVIMGAEALASGSVDLLVAGGMESMTNAPYLLKKHRAGARAGHDTAYDHMFLDGLEDAYEGGSMGSFAQVSADEYQLTRESMDAYTIESLSRAQAAIASGAFAGEVVPVTVKTRAGEVIVDTDEAPGKGRPDKIPGLKAAFAKDGTITAASSSSISDGAAAVVLARQSFADARGLTPVARIVAVAGHAQEPEPVIDEADVPRRPDAVRAAADRAADRAADEAEQAAPLLAEDLAMGLDVLKALLAKMEIEAEGRLEHWRFRHKKRGPTEMGPLVTRR